MSRKRSLSTNLKHSARYSTSCSDDEETSLNATEYFTKGQWERLNFFFKQQGETVHRIFRNTKTTSGVMVLFMVFNGLSKDVRDMVVNSEHVFKKNILLPASFDNVLFKKYRKLCTNGEYILKCKYCDFVTYMAYTMEHMAFVHDRHYGFGLKTHSGRDTSMPTLRRWDITTTSYCIFHVPNSGSRHFFRDHFTSLINYRYKQLDVHFNEPKNLLSDCYTKYLAHLERNGKLHTIDECHHENQIDGGNYCACIKTSIIFYQRFHNELFDLLNGLNLTNWREGRFEAIGYIRPQKLDSPEGDNVSLSKRIKFQKLRKHTRKSNIISQFKQSILKVYFDFFVKTDDEVEIKMSPEVISVPSDSDDESPPLPPKAAPSTSVAPEQGGYKPVLRSDVQITPFYTNPVYYVIVNDDGSNKTALDSGIKFSNGFLNSGGHTSSVATLAPSTQCIATSLTTTGAHQLSASTHQLSAGAHQLPTTTHQLSTSAHQLSAGTHQVPAGASLPTAISGQTPGIPNFGGLVSNSAPVMSTDAPAMRTESPGDRSPQPPNRQPCVQIPGSSFQALPAVEIKREYATPPLAATPASAGHSPERALELSVSPHTPPNGPPPSASQGRQTPTHVESCDLGAYTGANDRPVGMSHDVLPAASITVRTPASVSELLYAAQKSTNAVPDATTSHSTPGTPTSSKYCREKAQSPLRKRITRSSESASLGGVNDTWPNHSRASIRLSGPLAVTSFAPRITASAEAAFTTLNVDRPAETVSVAVGAGRSPAETVSVLKETILHGVSTSGHASGGSTSGHASVGALAGANTPPANRLQLEYAAATEPTIEDLSDDEIRQDDAGRRSSTECAATTDICGEDAGAVYQEPVQPPSPRLRPPSAHDCAAENGSRASMLNDSIINQFGMPPDTGSFDEEFTYVLDDIEAPVNALHTSPSIVEMFKKHILGVVPHEVTIEDYEEFKDLYRCLNAFKDVFQRLIARQSASASKEVDEARLRAFMECLDIDDILLASPRQRPSCSKSDKASDSCATASAEGPSGNNGLPKWSAKDPEVGSEEPCSIAVDDDSCQAYEADEENTSTVGMVSCSQLVLNDIAFNELGNRWAGSNTFRNVLQTEAERKTLSGVVVNMCNDSMPPTCDGSILTMPWTISAAPGAPVDIETAPRPVVRALPVSPPFSRQSPPKAGPSDVDTGRSAITDPLVAQTPAVATPVSSGRTMLGSRLGEVRKPGLKRLRSSLDALPRESCTGVKVSRSARSLDSADFSRAGAGSPGQLAEARLPRMLSSCGALPVPSDVNIQVSRDFRADCRTPANQMILSTIKHIINNNEYIGAKELVSVLDLLREFVASNHHRNDVE